jgi:hypothetical protein
MFNCISAAPPLLTSHLDQVRIPGLDGLPG